MLSLRFTKRAEKSAKSLIARSLEIARNIAKQIEKLCENPLPNNSRKLVNYPLYRCRVGNYRIIYEFDDAILHVTLIAKLDEVYKKVQKLYST